MEESRQTGPGRDYSGAFLVLILIGIVVVVLGLMMAVAHSNARPRTSLTRFEHGATHRARAVAPHRIYHSNRQIYGPGVEQIRPDQV